MRAALFLDFENLISTLKRKNAQGAGGFGEMPQLDFEALIAYVEENFGSLEQTDFIAAANFTHYNQQTGGLNRLATLVRLDSFEPRSVRSKEQHSPGKRHVVSNYTDMALAFEAGRHAATPPADVYLFVSGDADFAAVGQMLKDRYSRQVVFILPDADMAAQILKEGFTCVAFSDTQKPGPPSAGEGIPVATTMTAQASSQEDPFAELPQWVGALRREFRTAVPADLMRAMLGPRRAQRLLDHARSREVIDLWKNDSGVECISLHRERVVGRVVKMETRPVILRCGRVLMAAALESEAQKVPLGPAEWRKVVKSGFAFSNAEAKEWVELLYAAGILRHGHVGSLKLTLPAVVQFLKQAEEKFSASGSPPAL